MSSLKPPPLVLRSSADGEDSLTAKLEPQALVLRRQQHECTFTSKNLRRHGGTSSSKLVSRSTETNQSARSVLARNFNHLLQTVEAEQAAPSAPGSSTAGLERRLRWIGSADSGRSETQHEAAKRELIEASRDQVR